MERGRRQCMLLHSASKEVYDVYDSLQIPAESTYDEFNTLLSEYLAEKRNMQFVRYVFRNESQSVSQTIDNYYTKLKGLAKHCEFADIDDDIFSQIIQRCSDNHVREKRLSEPNFSLPSRLLYARSRESRGVPRIWEGGGQEIFFSDLGICMSRSDMLRMAKPCALLGGFGGMFPRENFLKRCNLVRFRVYFDQILSLFFSKNAIFYIKNKYFRYTFVMEDFS